MGFSWYSWDRQKIIELIEKVEKDEITWTILYPLIKIPKSST